VKASEFAPVENAVKNIVKPSARTISKIAEPVTEWLCIAPPGCTFNNKPGATICTICKIPKPKKNKLVKEPEESKVKTAIKASPVIN